jgi:hypothetical protein
MCLSRPPCESRMPSSRATEKSIAVRFPLPFLLHTHHCHNQRMITSLLQHHLPRSGPVVTTRPRIDAAAAGAEPLQPTGFAPRAPPKSPVHLTWQLSTLPSMYAAQALIFIAISHFTHKTPLYSLARIATSLPGGKIPLSPCSLLFALSYLATSTCMTICVGYLSWPSVAFPDTARKCGLRGGYGNRYGNIPGLPLQGHPW